MDYNEWNIEIASHFFNADNGGREVLLFVNKEKIRDLGKSRRTAVNDFIKAIKDEAKTTNGNICKRALQMYKNWRKFGFEYPPYIAYLAFFVLASTIEGNFDQKAYYPRFWKLLKKPFVGTPRGFYKTALLWEDLEKWSTENKKEELGRFKARIRGKWRHVGRPLSQTLLSDRERKALPEIFFDCGFDPTDIPSEDVIKQGLIQYGSRRLRRRTLFLLKSKGEGNQEFVNSLLHLVLTELEEWGRYEPPVLDEKVAISEKEKDHLEKKASPPSLFFRTCFRLDKPKRRVSLSLRIKTNRPFPDNGLSLKLDEKILTCFGTIPAGWSTKLVEKSKKTFFDPSTLNWLEEWKFIDKENGWEVTYKDTNIRLFLPGDEPGFPEFIESQKLLRNCDFIIICHNSVGTRIMKWGEKSCTQFTELSYVGIPDGWIMFKGRGAKESCHGIDVLGLSNLVKIQLEGGIAVRRSNQYLCFAPPRIKIDGGLGNEKLLVNGKEINKSPSAIYWKIPNAPIGRPLNIQIMCDGELLPESRVIKLIQPYLNSHSFRSVPQRDSKGDYVKAGTQTEYITGAYVAHSRKIKKETPRVLPTSLSEKLIFIGQVTGQISRWSLEPIPSSWTPVWILYGISTKKWATHFCRQKTTEDLRPIIRKKAFSRKDLNSWKEALWYRRKKTKPPKLPVLAELWKRYLEVARGI